MINIGDKVKTKSLNGSLESVKDAIDMKKNYDVIDIIEENRDLIEPYELKEIAKILGVTNITRFRNDLLKLTVDGQPVVMIQLVLNKSRILINPKVYYKGTRLDEVKNIEDDIRQILNKGKSKE